MRLKKAQFLIPIITVLTLFLSVERAFSADDILGLKTRSIQFSIDSPFEISFLELVNLLSITEGEIITRENLRKSVSGLHSKGVFKKISVYGERVGSEVDLIFHLEPSVSIASIKVKGVRYFSGKEVISKLRLRQGKLLTSVEASDVGNRLKDLYRKNGFFGAEVDIKVACSIEDGRGEMVIQVDEGERPIMNFADILGNENISDVEIMEILDVVAGRTVNLKKINRNVGKLMKRYKKKGFLLVKVSAPELVITNEGTNLIVVVDEGKRFYIEFKGNTRYSTAKLKRVSSIYSETANYEAGIIEAITEKIGFFYIEKGYPFARIDVDYLEEEGRITVRIDEGERGIIKSIDFDGNRYVSGKELTDAMDTSERGFFSFLTGTGVYRDETLNSDLENLRGYYQSKGFPNARFSLSELRSSGDGGLHLKINVDEGNRYIVRNIELKGVSFFAGQEIWRALKNIPGAPVDYVSAYADSWQIQKMYFDAGFHDCKVTISFKTEEEASNIEIIYTVNEGKRFVLGNVFVTGNSKVSSIVILRELPVSRGEVIGESDLIDFQQRLYRTGIFRAVKTRKIKEQEKAQINLLIEVEEADALVLEGGAGWGTDTGYRGSVGATHKNINGFGRKIQGNFIVSEKESKFTLDLTEPWFLGLNLEGGLNFTIQNTEEESFTLEKISLGGSLTREFWERSSTSFEITFNRERTKDVSPGAIISPEDVRDDRTIIFRPILVLDQRDDPFNPRRGTFNSIVGEFSPGIIGSEIQYFKITGQSVVYFKLKKRIVFALSGRGGYGESLGGGELPIDKRFLLGGRTTVRGFEEDRLGPIGADGSPIGGDTMVNFNSEGRYYITNSLIFALFYDVGSVWLRGFDEFDFDLRDTAGYSIKYVTPVGPVSFDQGFKLDRKPGESKSEIHFTIGAAF